MSDEQHYAESLMFRALTPAVRALLLANIIVFALQWLTGDLAAFALYPWNAQQLYGTPSFEPWQLVTYAFLHGGFWHIFLNMLALYMFGPDVEDVIGSRRFTLYYFVCVIGAGITQLIVSSWVHPSPEATIGASGGIFGVLLFYGLMFPHRKVLVYFAIPMPAWLFVTLYGVLELYQGVAGTQQGVAHFAHLGGMAFGYPLILYWRHRRYR